MKYGALIVGMILTLEMRTSKLKIKSDSYLVTIQVSEQYQAKEPQMIKYLQKVRNISSCLTSFEIEHVTREQTFRAYRLPKLATSKKTRFNKVIIKETLASSNNKVGEVYSLEVILEPS